MRGLVAAGALIALLVAPTASAEPPKKVWTERTWATPLDPDAPVSMKAFAKLARELSPAVVNINVKSAGPRGGGGGPLAPFFGGGDGKRGLGSGFIIHADGYVLTNNHVVDGFDDIEVKTADDRIYAATVVGTYAELDLALLQVQADHPLTVAPLGNSTALEIGEWVIAIGNPFGLNHTVTAGIVSAKGRRAESREPMYARFIQTDASINPGNSGGPLINIRGEVIGINTAINANGQGIGFAVPIDMVKKILPQLAVGRVSKSYLGVRVGPVARELAHRLSMQKPMGALVREVLGGTPAALAGVLPGDIIVKWNGKAIDHWEDLPWLASTTGAGASVKVVINRGGKAMNLRVQLGNFPTTATAAAPAVRAAPSNPAAPVATGDIGLTLSEVPSAARADLGLKPGEGVYVSEVSARSPAQAIGIRVGDVITHVNYEAVTSGMDIATAIDGVPEGEVLSFTVRRKDRVLFKAFTR